MWVSVNGRAAGSTSHTHMELLCETILKIEIVLLKTKEKAKPWEH